jgi:adenosine kinase
MFNGEELRRFIAQASWVTVNDYEWHMLEERTGCTPADVTQQLRALIVTRGAKGSQIYTEEGTYEIPLAKTHKIMDPTGCGDAYRAGLTYGLMNELDWETTGRIASLLGAIKIECHGTQNHHFDPAEFKARYRASFGRGL